MVLKHCEDRGVGRCAGQGWFVDRDEGRDTPAGGAFVRYLVPWATSELMALLFQWAPSEI